MRLLLSLLVAAGVAGGVWYLLSDPAPPRLPPDPVPRKPAAVESDEPQRPVARYAGLIVVLLGPDRKPVADGEVGTDLGGAVRWAPAGLDGKRSYPDMEPGYVRILGRAPGFESVEQRRLLVAGVRTEVRMVLTPSPPR